ncbi:MAG: nitrogenase-stabilizing/protective protein NifW [Gammaproteobacteria bacterium]|nr:nitrogenase-stabilizing/protective protein NifW [Gammaproteobacteria bacterium]MCP5423725.1 nitrogenase-stabilizing/protective protein NifW [Gammaproteobacteria bacterium]MCP5459693.1 nitrogenase-stabilizing/protective protein NifW [Gammaproteobacteria bacterium]
MLPESSIKAAMSEMESAEDFLQYFEVEFDPAVVHVNRLHILQRFHDYLDQATIPEDDEDAQRALYAGYLRQAYQDFVVSDARTEKVFKVFKEHPQEVLIPLDQLRK